MQLQVGDILLYKSATGFKFSTLVPELIRLCTGNKIIHTAMYLGEQEGKPLIIESAGNGVNLYRLNDVMYRQYYTLVAIARLPNLPKEAYAYKTYRYVGAHYGVLTIINILFQHGKCRIFPKRPWTTWFKSSEAYICSELCQRLVEDVTSMTFPKPAHLVEPDDFLAYPWEITYTSENN